MSQTKATFRQIHNAVSVVTVKKFSVHNSAMNYFTIPGVVTLQDIPYNKTNIKVIELLTPIA